MAKAKKYWFIETVTPNDIHFKIRWESRDTTIAYLKDILNHLEDGTEKTCTIKYGKS